MASIVTIALVLVSPVHTATSAPGNRVRRIEGNFEKQRGQQRGSA